MILQDGSEIPDPPEDKEERKKWKEKYFFLLYRSDLRSFKELILKDEDKCQP